MSLPSESPRSTRIAPPGGLVLDDIRISLEGVPLLALSARIAPGTVTSVMGPSGAGKSTLLAAIAGTLAPAFALSGRITLDGADLRALPAQARHVGLLFQDALLFPHLSVLGNLLIALPPEIRGRAARRLEAEKALARIGLGGFGPRDPATLSGGQAARLSLARTLLARPRALLLDEPFSRLDSALRQTMRALVFDTARDAALPVLMVTHDPDDAAAAGGPILRL